MLSGGKMTLINIACPLKQDEIRKVLESQTSPVYRYVQRLAPVETQFEVECDDTIDVIRNTKKMIRSLPDGKVLFFRVLYDGQFFEDGPIYDPDSAEYKALHKRKSIR